MLDRLASHLCRPSRLHIQEGAMKNFFFYATRDSETFRWVEHFLSHLHLDGTLITLPPGSEFTSPLCLQLRSNDIFILFAQNEKDINDLLTLRDEYESFRIVLLMKNEQQAIDSKYQLLTPRFVFFLDSNIDDLSAYLKNLIKNNR
jgi:hypothetical protein